MTVHDLRTTLIVVRTVVAIQQVIVITLLSVDLMQTSSLGTNGSLITAAKTSKVQNEKFRICEIAGEVLLRRQVGSTHSR